MAEQRKAEMAYNTKEGGKNVRERIFCFDLVRVICPFLTIIYHYSAESYSRAMGYTTLLLSNIGGVANDLFFLVSGGALAWQYMESLDPRAFYKKRWKGIFPLFYILWVCMWILRSAMEKTLFLRPAITFPLTILGMDGLLYDRFSTWYMIGEWFLGAIILCYAIFPLLRLVAKKNYAIGLAVLFAWEIVNLFTGAYLISIEHDLVMVFTCFYLGMGIVIYREKLSKSPVSWGLALFLLIFGKLVLSVKNAPAYEQSMAVGIFLLLVMGEMLLKKKRAASVPAWMHSAARFVSGTAKLSYPVYLIQHVAILAILTAIPSLTGNGLDLLALGLLLIYGSAWVIVTVQNRWKGKMGEKR